MSCSGFGVFVCLFFKFPDQASYISERFAAVLLVIKVVGFLKAVSMHIHIYICIYTYIYACTHSPPPEKIMLSERGF